MNQDFPPPIYRQRTNGLAITSLVLGICSVFMCCLTGLPAVIFGIFGLRQIGKNPGMDGKGMAIAGIVIGAISLLFLLPILASFALPAVAVALEKANQTKELNESRVLGTALKIYAENHGGKYPDSMDVLLEDKTLPDVEKLIHGEFSYQDKWILTPGLTTGSAGDTVLFRSKNSTGTGIHSSHVVYTVDGTAKIVRDNSD